MSLFLDNDVLEKLASWQLLDEGVRACGCSPDSVRVLPTAKFRLGLAGKKRRTKYAEEVLERIWTFLGTAQECAEEPPARRAALVDVPNLDAGEAILFTHAAEVDGALLATGDKRSIEAVASVPECAGLARDLAGRVLCLEQVLLRVIDAHGFDVVKARIVNSNALHLDTAVRAAFGSGIQALEHNACGGLEHTRPGVGGESPRTPGAAGLPLRGRRRPNGLRGRARPRPHCSVDSPSRRWRSGQPCSSSRAARAFCTEPP